MALPYDYSMASKYSKFMRKYVPRHFKLSATSEGYVFEEEPLDYDAAKVPLFGPVKCNHPRAGPLSHRAFTPRSSGWKRWRGRPTGPRRRATGPLLRGWLAGSRRLRDGSTWRRCQTAQRWWHWKHGLRRWQEREWRRRQPRSDSSGGWPPGRHVLFAASCGRLAGVPAAPVQRLRRRLRGLRLGCEVPQLLLCSCLQCAC